MNQYEITVEGLAPAICYVWARAEVEAAGGAVVSEQPAERRDLGAAADVLTIVVTGGPLVLKAVKSLVEKYRGQGGESEWRELDGYR